MKTLMIRLAIVGVVVLAGSAGRVPILGPTPSVEASLQAPDTTDDVGSQSSIQLDAHGRPVIAYWKGTGSELRILVCSNRACSGNQYPVTADVVGDVGQNPSLALAAGGIPVVAYYDDTNDDLKLVRCANAACSVPTVPVVVDGAGGLSRGASSALALDSANRPVIAYSDHGTQDFRFVRCGDMTCSAGNTYAVLSFGLGTNPSIALDGADVPYITYLDASSYPHLVRCGDPTCSSFVTTAQLDPDIGFKSTHQSLALDALDHPVIAYEAHKTTASGVLSQARMLSCDDPLCLSETPIVVDGGGTSAASTWNRAAGISLRIMGDGRPVIGRIERRSDGAGSETDFNRVVITQCSGLDVCFPDGVLVATYATVSATAPGLSLAIGPFSTPVVSYYDPDAQDLAVYCDACDGMFGVFTIDGTSSDDGQYSSLALDPHDRPVVSYYDATNSRLMLMTCGQEWCPAGSQTLRAPDAGPSGQYTSLTLRQGLYPMVSYQDPVNQRVKLYTCNDAPCTSGQFATVDATSGTGQSNEMMMMANDQPAFSYLATGGGLRLTRCMAFDCLPPDPVTVTTTEPSGAGGYQIGMGNLSYSRPIVGYRDTVDDTLNVLVCDFTATGCNSGVTITQPDASSNDLAQFVALDIGLTASGVTPFIAYTDSTTASLKLLRCGNLTCTSGNTISTVLSDAPGIGNLSIWAPEAGCCVTIVYYAIGSGDLKMVSCVSETCTSKVVTTLDSVGNVGGFNSLAFDSASRPVISYYDYTNRNLKLVRCRESDCRDLSYPDDLDWDGFSNDPPDGVHQGPANTDNALDNCPSLYDESQKNSDGDHTDLSPPKAFDDKTSPRSDAVGDACDADDDNDGRTDEQEAAGCGSGATNRLAADSDGDRFLDGAECRLGTNPNSALSTPALTACGTTTDGDADGINARNESCFYGTSDATADSDGDGCGDGREMASVNADRSVNAIDLSQVSQSFGPYTIPASAEKYDFDMNKDGAISAIDLSQVAQRVGVCP